MDADCRVPVWVVCLIGLLLGGCNVFEVSTPIPSTVDALLSDARTALAMGNPTRAVRLLERAYEKDSSDVRVRVALGNAVYSEQGLDVFALQNAMAQFVDSTGSSGTSAAVPVPRRKGDVCTDGVESPDEDDRYTRIPLDAAPLRRWADHASVVARVQALVVEGVLKRRAAAFESASVPARRKGYLVGAVTAVARHILEARRAAEAAGSVLYLDRGAQPRSAVVACAQNEGQLRRTHDALCALHGATQRSVQWLQARKRLSGPEDEGAVLRDLLQDLAEAVGARVDCT